MVIAELLPGAYDNREQVYFDQRGGVPKEKQHNRMHEIVARVDLPAFGPFVFFIQDSRDNKLDAPTRLRLYTFSTDKADPDRVRMRIWQLDDVARYRDAHKNPAVLADLAPATTRFAEGCDVFWKREAGQFKAATDPATCRITIAGKKVTGEYQFNCRPMPARCGYSTAASTVLASWWRDTRRACRTRCCVSATFSVTSTCRASRAGAPSRSNAMGPSRQSIKAARSCS